MSATLSRGGTYRDEVLALFDQPRQADRLSEGAWSEIVATARNAHLLGKLAAVLERAGQVPPEAPQRHLAGALSLSTRQRQSVVWEARQIDEALAPLGQPVVLLKGAAYAIAELAPADGRLFGDVDVLVQRDVLADVEHQLMRNGWTPIKTDAYDQRYYRQWMHEIPPLMHVRRGTVIDIHHTILPLTAQHRPVPARIFRNAIAVSGHEQLMTPAPEDLIVHSLCHLVHEGEVNHLLRDMHDIACLLADQAGSPGFQARLMAAASDHDLTGPCALGLALVARYFGSEFTRSASKAMAGHGGSHDHTKLLSLYDVALQPSPTGQANFAAQLARTRIYLRSHRLRMPLPMLFRHLTRKAWMRLKTRPTSPPQPG